MRLFIALLLLVTFAVPASAEWVKVYGDSSTHIEHFVDRDTIRRHDGRASAWVLQNMGERGENGELSIRYLRENDCVKGRTRMLSLSTHSHRWAKGDTIVPNTRLPHPEWDYAVPNSVADLLLKSICND